MSTQLSLNLENKPELLEQFRGAFIGAAVGDALGFITEFVRSSSELRKQYGVDRLTQFISWQRPTYYQGRRYLIRLPIPAGTYSDDTQLTIATTRAIRADGTFDVESFAKLELSLWLNYALGGGTGTKAATRNLRKKRVTWYNNFFSASYTRYINSGGNGAAMRILPIALVNIDNREQFYSDVWRNAIVTHGHLRGLVGAVLFADAISQLIKHPSSKLDWFDTLTAQCDKGYPHLIDIWSKIPEFAEWRQMWETKAKQAFEKALKDICAETTNYLKITRKHMQDDKPQHLLSELGCYSRQTKGAGNATVIAAMFFLCRSNSFEDAIISVANEIGIDTDTIGYFVGAMFGAYYGLDVIPASFRENCQDGDYLVSLADWCYEVYSKTADPKSAFTYPNIEDQDGFQMRDFLPNGIQKPNTPVQIPIFGKGKIIGDTDITPDWRENHVYWLQIALDFGQRIFLQVTRSVPKNKNTSRPSNEDRSEHKEQDIADSLTVLDQYKNKVASSNFDPNVTIEVIHRIKYDKRDKALYNAFTTWLWAALPEKAKENAGEK